MEHHKWGRKSLERMQGVNPILIDFASRLLHESPWDLTIGYLGGVRTAEEQRGLFDKGYSKCDGTHKKSYHQSGNAIDIIIYGKTVDEMYDIEKLDHLGELGKEIWRDMWREGVVDDWTPIWGGDWKSFVDRPHWELRRK